MVRYIFRLVAGCLALCAAVIFAAAAAEYDDDRVVAQSAGVEVTLGDLKAFVEQVRLDRSIDAQPDEDTLLGIAEQILLYRALAAEAEREGLDRQPSLARRLQIKREELLGAARLAEVEANAPAVDLEQIAEETYLANKARFVRPEEVRAAHILIGVEKRSEEEAQALAERLRAELAEDPGRFAVLARDNSDDPASAEKGGDLGWFPRAKMVAPFADAAFALQTPGELSPVVHTEFGYHIIRLDERRPGERIPFEEVKATLIEQERSAHRKRVRREYAGKIITAPDVRYEHGVLEGYARSLQPIPSAAAD